MDSSATDDSGEPREVADTATEQHVGRRWRTVAALFTLAALLIAIGGIALWRDRSRLADEVDTLTTKLDVARGDAGAEIASLEDELAEVTAERDAARAEFTAADTERETLDARLDETRAQLDLRTEERDQARALAAELAEELAVVGPVKTPMIDLLGGTLENAEEFAREWELVLLVEESNPPNVIARPGTILEQLPEIDVVVVPGSVIWIELFTPVED